MLNWQNRNQPTKIQSKILLGKSFTRRIFLQGPGFGSQFVFFWKKDYVFFMKDRPPYIFLEGGGCFMWWRGGCVLCFLEDDVSSEKNKTLDPMIY